jgi:NADH-quinone oxidoreductase subunit M
VGEYLVLQGAAQVNFRWAVLAAVGVILSACYMLWLYQRVFLGETPAAVRAHVGDVRPRELAAMLPLIVLMVWMGTATHTFLRPISAASGAILQHTRANQEYHAQARPGLLPSHERQRVVQEIPRAR